MSIDMQALARIAVCDALSESQRLLKVGRDLQRGIDVQILRVRIAELRRDFNNLTATLAADELDELVEEIESTGENEEVARRKRREQK